MQPSLGVLDSLGRVGRVQEDQVMRTHPQRRGPVFFLVRTAVKGQGSRALHTSPDAWFYFEFAQGTTLRS